MIYLDYSATTPVNSDVLDSFVTTTREYIGNANSIHNLGVKSKELYLKATKQITDILGVNNNEIIYTSGASESNSMAILGVAKEYGKKKKHIITTPLEHKSVLEVMEKLEKQGFEISYVKLQENGQIDLNDLSELVRDDTFFVSVCAVNSEVGYKAPLKTIRQVINKKNKDVIIHSDMTQALGKIKINLNDVDLASFSSHKIYAPKGIGILYKKSNIKIEPMIYGLTDNSPLRGGTPCLPLVVSFSKAMRMVYEDFNEKVNKVEFLKCLIVKGLSDLDININSNELCVPHILNISLKNIRSEIFLRALDKEEIYISTKSACSSNSDKSVLQYVTPDAKINSTSIRISISYYTTVEEANKFVEVFRDVYNGLVRKDG